VNACSGPTTSVAPSVGCTMTNYLKLRISFRMAIPWESP
jgi:hypothetical protein